MANKAGGFTAFSSAISHMTGRPATFMLAIASIVIWALIGPFVGFSEKWQLIVNTGTTIITFLMVFLLQNTQNRDIMALHAKLDELILASEATNRLIGVEKLSDVEIEHMSEELAAEAQSILDATAEEKADELVATATEAAKKAVAVQES